MDEQTGFVTTTPENSLRVRPLTGPLCGTCYPPGDRCITHRALILGAISRGPTRLLGVLDSPVTVDTRRVLAQLGVAFTRDDDGWLVISRHAGHLAAPDIDLDCGNSATTLWLMTGLLAGLGLATSLTGSDQLLAQDCSGLIEQLRTMGARIETLGAGQRPPLNIAGRQLTATEADIPPAAYLLKDALLLAGLVAKGTTRLVGAVNGHDHLERLLRLMGVSVRRSGITLSIKGQQNVHPRQIMIPGDITAISPLVVAATFVPGSDIAIQQLGANPGRMGLVKTLHRIGANIDRERDWQFGSEPVTNLRIRHTAGLEPFNIAPNLSPFLLDEFPLLALAATQIDGTSHLRNGHSPATSAPNAPQLTAQILRSFGADIEQSADGFTVRGPTRLTGTEVQCSENLGLSLLALAAALIAEGPSTLHAASVLAETYPGLPAEISRLAGITSTGYNCT